MLCFAARNKKLKKVFFYIDLIVNKNRQKEEGYWKDEQWTIKISKGDDEVEERDINIAQRDRACRSNSIDKKSYKKTMKR